MSYSTLVGLPVKSGSEGVLSAEVVKGDVLGLDAEVFAHFLNANVHHRRTTVVVFNFFGGRMIFQVIVDHDLMNAVSYTHLRAPRDLSTSRMPSSA